jgi:hypothetical protein
MRAACSPYLPFVICLIMIGEKYLTNDEVFLFCSFRLLHNVSQFGTFSVLSSSEYQRSLFEHGIGLDSI